MTLLRALQNRWRITLGCELTPRHFIAVSVGCMREVFAHQILNWRLMDLQIERITFMFKTIRAVKFLFTGPLVLALLVIINLMTSPNHW